MLRLRPTAVEWRQTGDEVVALEIATSTYIAINGAGTVLWPALAEGTTRQHLIEQLVNRFSISPERAAVDVDAFVGTLRQRDLLEEQ